MFLSYEVCIYNSCNVLFLLKYISYISQQLREWFSQYNIIETQMYLAFAMGLQQGRSGAFSLFSSTGSGLLALKGSWLSEVLGD